MSAASLMPYNFHRGSLPLLISVPHAGKLVPDELQPKLTQIARSLPDTDWYVDQLYGFAEQMGASIIRATYSRYVVDLNRSPDSASLYPNAPTSPVCPTHTFAGEALYREGTQPDDAEIADRLERYWHPYHQCIAEEIWRIRSDHGSALLWDAHSIASRMPTLFEGELPAFNFGTRDDSSCPRAIGEALLRTIQ
jgi:N-formylglutamate deformylase